MYQEDSGGASNGHLNGLDVKPVEGNGVQEIHNIENLKNGNQNGNGLSTNVIEVEKPDKTSPRGDDIRKGDEYEVNFADTRPFTISRWVDILKNVEAKLTEKDLKTAKNYREWENLAREIQARLNDPASTQLMKRQMAKIQSLPHVLASLSRKFTRLVAPREVHFEILWGLVFVNLKLSYASPIRLKRTSEFLEKIRRVTELFNRCLENCEEDNEARIAVVDFLDPIMIILTDSITYFHECSSDKDAEDAWPELYDNINQQLSALDSTVKHVNDITSYSKVNLDRKIKNMSMRHALMPESEEPGTFPNKLLPFKINPRFYGRKDELDKVVKYLSPKDDLSLRTYTIYGRRGVGKTEIALQFAHTNPAGYDALFWIQCETSVAIRESFTKVAVSLNLPGADRDGHHEENLLAVHKWLKRTQKKWLMIFDNAEKDHILRPYWPIGASGAILITSRQYFNFSKDTERRGDTIKPFSPRESWDLILQLLGDDWKRDEREGRIAPSEVAAATSMLKRLEGLALAIQQAAILIKDPEIGGPTIAKTYETFKERLRTLPDRHKSSRSSSVSALDALWDMIFKSLSKHARSLIAVLAWLSPDQIPIQLFLPQNQLALEGLLSFCMQDSIHLDDQHQASLASLTTPSKDLELAINELVQRELIRQDGMIFSIHRVVQEAVNYSDAEELQASFDTAARLVWEQFPKPEMNGSLFNEWSVCQEYIPHGIYLSKKFSDYDRGSLKGTLTFVRLLCNAAWYLYEVGDFDACARVIDTGVMACDDKSSLLYAQLRNIAGGRYFDLNRISDSRKAWEDTLRIRKALLPHDAYGIAAIYNNLGNLELAAGNVEESTEHFNRATQIWSAGGNAAASNLALTYLCVGRVEMLRGNFPEAMSMTTLAESLFKRTIGSDKGFMANVHFAYGNIHFLQKHYQLAWRSYDACLKIGQNQMPIHPITVAANYSLGCVEFEMSHRDWAKAYLDKARAIAELRSPIRDDGPIARILWKTAVVLEADTFGSFAKEAAELRAKAEVARLNLAASGEGGLIPFVDEDDNERNQEEDSYDALVPLFYR